MARTFVGHTANGHKAWQVDDDGPMHKGRPLTPVELRYERSRLAMAMLQLMWEEPVEDAAPPGFTTTLQRALTQVARLQHLAAQEEDALRQYQARLARQMAESHREPEEEE